MVNTSPPVGSPNPKPSFHITRDGCQGFLYPGPNRAYVLVVSAANPITLPGSEHRYSGKFVFSLQTAKFQPYLIPLAEYSTCSIQLTENSTPAVIPVELFTPVIRRPLQAYLATERGEEILAEFQDYFFRLDRDTLTSQLKDARARASALERELRDLHDAHRESYIGPSQ